MNLLDGLKNIPKNIRQKLSFNSNKSTVNANSSYYGNGYYRNHLRYKHEGKFSYDDYQKILDDTQVEVAIDTLLYFLLSKGYNITSASDNQQDVEIRDFIQDMFDNMDTPFRKVRKDLYTSIKYGFACLEKVYDTNSDGHIILKGLYGIHMKTLQNQPFVKNEKGELTEIHQESANGSCNIPIEKILLSRYNAEFDELYGNSILNRVHEYPKLKNDIITWLMTFLHKHENPVTYAKLAGNSAFKKDVLNMLDEIAEGRTSMTIGKDDELNTLESTHRGEAFFNALNYYDNLIFRGLFLGNLLLGDGGQTGSYAQSHTQLTVANTIFDGIHEDIAFDIQRVIDQIVYWNFGNVKTPSFAFDKFTEKDTIALLNALQPYASNMIIDTESAWFKEVIAKVVQELSDVKVDLEDNTPDESNDDVDYGMQPPLPGQKEAEIIVKQQLEGIV